MSIRTVRSVSLSTEGIHPLYRDLPIAECGEPLQEIPAVFPRLLPHPYLAAGAPYGGGSPWQLREGVVAALEDAQAHLHCYCPGWRIAVFDAYRPLAVQAFMVWRQFHQEAALLGCLADLRTVADPVALREEWPDLYRTLAPAVYRFWGLADPDPARPPPHSTGAALDCTLVDGEGHLVAMGGPVDDFTARAVPDFFRKGRPGSPEAGYHVHRQKLAEAMAASGFRQHPGEWWHFSLGDQLWAWRAGHPEARYGRADLP